MSINKNLTKIEKNYEICKICPSISVILFYIEDCFKESNYKKNKEVDCK